MSFLATLGLFVTTAVAEILGCYLPYLRLKRQGSPLVADTSGSEPGSLCLVAHAASHSSRTRVRGVRGVYVMVAVFWLWVVDGVRPTTWDVFGAFVCVLGMAIIMFSPRPL